MAEQYNDFKESQNILDVGAKATFVAAMFKGLFDLQEEGIIKDFLKDDHHVQIRDSVRNVLKNEKIEKDINNNEDLLNAFKKYSNLEIKADEKKEQQQKNRNNQDIKVDEKKEHQQKNRNNQDKIYFVWKIKVKNSFNLVLKIDANSQQIMHTLSVGAFKEKIDFPFKINKCFLIQCKIGPESKSNYNLMKKLTILFDDRLKRSISIFKRDNLSLFQKVYSNLNIFFRYLDDYYDLYSKKCSFCGKITKYNPKEKEFYPPYYRFYDLDKQLFYHEDCYAIVYNKAA